MRSGSGYREGMFSALGLERPRSYRNTHTKEYSILSLISIIRSFYCLLPMNGFVWKREQSEGIILSTLITKEKKVDF